MPSADEILTSLESKQKQAAELQRKLKGSLALQAFMPDAFAHGTCKVGGRSNPFRPHQGTVTFTLGNGDVREMPAMAVPFHLWPYQMQDDFKRLPTHQRKSLERKMGIEL
jgi:hypothetical protein